MQVRFIRSLLLAAGVLLMSTASFGQIGVSVTIAPPALPVYEQPICPTDGYIWTPGYWAWADGDYYWVPGAWVMAPEVGYLWTPGYWGWGGGRYLFNAGYWGPTIGFYGGINYGFGYFGHGYEGGRWDNGHFFYNTTINNVNVNVSHNVYNTRVNVAAVSRVSFNGGTGGIEAHATVQEDAAAHERHIPAVAAQTQHAEAARTDPQARLAANHGAPPAASTASRSGGSAAASTAVHPKDLPPVAHTAPAPTGNAKVDKQNQKDQDALAAKQTQDRQKLQQQQDKEHQQLTTQKASAAKTQQVEQQHQQQTQKLQQTHAQQTQQLQQRQKPAAAPRGGGSRP